MSLFRSVSICSQCVNRQYHRHLQFTHKTRLVSKLLRHRWRSVRQVQCAYSSTTSKPDKQKKIDLSQFPVENIRNFSIIAHVDHGKSTLADRLLEITGTISKDAKNEQVLDRLPVERERGITVKAQSVALIYHHKGTSYLLNLIDTPGHVDFHYEVSRSLAACQGVILLVDANQGVQAQTVANFYLAFESELTMIPVLNKIDLKVARPDEIIQQMTSLFDVKESEILKVSAKFGTGVDALLEAVVERLPPPPSDRTKPLKALLFDSGYDRYRGAVTDLAVIDGSISKGDQIKSCVTGKTYEVQEVGIKYPDEYPTDVLYAGQVGYMMCNMRNIEEAQIGDTICHEHSPVEAMAGFKKATPMVFAGIFPSDQSEYNNLRSAIERLTLNDSSVSMQSDSSPALGQGWRLGFLGLLHMDVFQQRLEQEFGASAIVTVPNVPYKVKITGAKLVKQHGKEELTILNPCMLPDVSVITEFQEPYVLGTIITPDQYLGDITALCLDCRGVHKDQTYIDNTRIIMKVFLPLNEILVDFYDTIKSLSSGYASFDYEDHGYEVSDLLKLTILLNGQEIDELTQICHVSKARNLGKRICARLKETIPRQLYLVIIQAAVGKKIIAREDVKALRKDVLAKCYGGDITRKMKLLRRQAEGKKKMRKIGNIEIPKDAFVKVLKR